MPGKQYTSVRDYIMFTEAWFFLAKARLMLVVRPFRKILPTLTNTGEIKNPSPEELQRIKLSIARACVRSPWRTKCFEQALAAKMMTRRRGLATVTFFGVRKEAGSDTLQAHAWLKCDDFIVTGWQRVDSYTVVGEF